MHIIVLVVGGSLNQLLIMFTTDSHHPASQAMKTETFYQQVVSAFLK